MRKAILASFFIALSATAVLSQQTPAPEPDEAAPAPVVRDPHSMKADLAVPLCSGPFHDSLATNGIAGSGDKDVIHPVPRYQPDAELSDEALRLKRKNQTLSFEVDLSLVVDTNGKPQSVCLLKSAGYGLDANAAKTVQKYQFEPATKDGNPVPNRVSIEMTFRDF
jgi:TonB family protein